MDLMFALFVVLSLGALFGTFFVMAKAARAYGAKAARKKSAGLTRPCPTCKAKMELVGVDHLLGGDHSAAGVQTAGPGGNGRVSLPSGLPVEVYACTICQKVELALAPSALADLTPARSEGAAG